MALSIASNTDSLKVQTNLRRTTDQLSTTFERLSSGLRINRASDDPAGLALADGLRRDALLTSVAVRNVNDGLSLASIADSALGEIGNMLTRMSELANQSSNSVYTNTQRSALSSEFIALGSEVERISRTTTFNGITLLSNSATVTIQAGITGGTNSQIAIEAVLATISALGLGNASGALSYSLTGVSVDAAVTSSRLALTALTSASDSLSNSRGTVGAAESRLSYAVNYLSVARENLAAAESQIRDADIAQEVAEMVRLQVIQQAATAVLAQANQQPATVLKLLE